MARYAYLLVLLVLLSGVARAQSWQPSSGFANVINCSGTSLAAGSTSAIGSCFVALSKFMPNPLACQTVARAVISANHAAAVDAQLVLGVSNPETAAGPPSFGGSYPMGPYVGLSHAGTLIPQTSVASGKLGNIVDIRMDEVVDDTDFAGSQCNPKQNPAACVPPVVLPNGLNGTSVPVISGQIANLASSGGALDYQMALAVVCVPTLNCIKLTGCGSNTAPW